MPTYFLRRCVQTALLTTLFAANASTATIQDMSICPEASPLQNYGAGISDDGRYVLYSCFGGSVLTMLSSKGGEVIWRDRTAAKGVMITVGWDGAVANGDSNGEAISGDGAWIAFATTMNNLTATDINDYSKYTPRMVLYERTTKAITIIENGLGPAALDHDGRHLIYFMNDDGALRPHIYDRVAKTSALMVNIAANTSYSFSRVDISNDGNLVALEARDPSRGGAVGVDGIIDVYAFNRTTKSLTNISRAVGGGLSNGPSQLPRVSGDGSTIAFVSRASNLVTGDSNAAYDAFIYKVATKSTTLVSRNSAGVIGNDKTIDIDISRTGRFVTMSSQASNLVVGDTNGKLDVFLKDLLTGKVTRRSVQSSGAQNDRDADNVYMTVESGKIDVVFDGTNLTTGPDDSNFNFNMDEEQNVYLSQAPEPIVFVIPPWLKDLLDRIRILLESRFPRANG